MWCILECNSSRCYYVAPRGVHYKRELGQCIFFFFILWSHIFYFFNITNQTVVHDCLKVFLCIVVWGSDWVTYFNKSTSCTFKLIRWDLVLLIAFCGTKPTERRFEEQRGKPSAGTHLSVLFSGLHFDLFIPLIILLFSYHGNRVGDFTGYSVMQVNLKLFLEMVISVSLTLRLAETLTEISLLLVTMNLTDLSHPLLRM